MAGRTVTQDMEEKIISRYAKGMTTVDIEVHLKELYDLTAMDITKKWTGRRRDWSQIRAQPEIFFEERLEGL